MRHCATAAALGSKGGRSAVRCRVCFSIFVVRGGFGGRYHCGDNNRIDSEFGLENCSDTTSSDSLKSEACLLHSARGLARLALRISGFASQNSSRQRQQLIESDTHREQGLPSSLPFQVPVKQSRTRCSVGPGHQILEINKREFISPSKRDI